MLTKLLHCTSIVSALVFVLVLKLHVATFSHEDLLQADIRYQKLKAANLGLSLSDGNVHGMGSMPWQSGPLSNQLMTIGWNAEISLVSACVISLGSISMQNILSIATRDDPKHPVHALFLLLSVSSLALMVAGIIFFFLQIHKCSLVGYPLYESNTKGIHDGMMVWNATTESFGQRDFVKYSVNDGVTSLQILNFSFLSIFSACVFSHLICMFWRKK